MREEKNSEEILENYIRNWNAVFANLCMYNSIFFASETAKYDCKRNAPKLC